MRKVNDVLNDYSDIERKVRKATSNKSYAASSLLMAEISDATYNGAQYPQVMNMIWKRLNEPGKYWRHTYKALILMEFLLKVGSEKVVSNVKENVFALATLQEFTHVDSFGKDEGAAVRQKAGVLVELVKNDAKLRSIREKALEDQKRSRRQQTQTQKDVANSYQHSDSGSRRMEPAPTHSKLFDPNAGSNSEAARAKRNKILAIEEEQLKLALEMSMADSKTEAQRREQTEENDPDLQAAIALSKVDAMFEPTQSSTATASDPFDLFGNNSQASTTIRTSQSSERPASNLFDPFDPFATTMPSNNSTSFVGAGTSLFDTPPVNEPSRTQPQATQLSTNVFGDFNAVAYNPVQSSNQFGETNPMGYRSAQPSNQFGETHSGVFNPTQPSNQFGETNPMGYKSPHTSNLFGETNPMGYKSPQTSNQFGETNPMGYKSPQTSNQFGETNARTFSPTQPSNLFGETNSMGYKPSQPFNQFGETNPGAFNPTQPSNQFGEANSMGYKPSQPFNQFGETNPGAFNPTQPSNQFTDNTAMKYKSSPVFGGVQVLNANIKPNMTRPQSTASPLTQTTNDDFVKLSMRNSPQPMPAMQPTNNNNPWNMAPMGSALPRPVSTTGVLTPSGSGPATATRSASGGMGAGGDKYHSLISLDTLSSNSQPSPASPFAAKNNPFGVSSNPPQGMGTGYGGGMPPMQQPMSSPMQSMSGMNMTGNRSPMGYQLSGMQPTQQGNMGGMSQAGYNPSIHNAASSSPNKQKPLPTANNNFNPFA